MAYRVQLSLQISDENLYRGFIEELKLNRELNSKVVDLLRAYYYDTNSRNSIETYLNDGETIEEYDTSNNISDIISNIRSTIAMTDYYATEAMQTLEEGTEDINDILAHTAEKAQEDGFVDGYSMGDFGIEVPQIAMKSPSQVQKVVEKVATKTQNSDASNASDVMNLLMKLCEFVGFDPNSVQVENSTSSITETPTTKDTQITENYTTVASSSETRVEKEVIVNTEVSLENNVSVNQEVVNNEVTPSSKEEPKSVVPKANDDMVADLDIAPPPSTAPLQEEDSRVAAGRQAIEASLTDVMRDLGIEF